MYMAENNVETTSQIASQEYRNLVAETMIAARPPSSSGLESGLEDKVCCVLER